MFFEIMRFNILTFAATEPGSKMDKAYVFAWAARVFPIYHDQQGERQAHKPFADQFEVSDEMMTRLTDDLDARWLKKNVPTFYDLDHEFGGTDRWDRVTLMRACRYICLTNRFDEEFRSALLKERPSEASALSEPFAWETDVIPYP